MLVGEAGPTLRWLHAQGMRYRLLYERQAYRRPDGSHVFWGGLHVGNVGGGQGLMADHLAIADRLGVRVRYDSAVTELLHQDGRVTGVVAHLPDSEHREIPAESVILAAGGFEADPDRRERHLGPGLQPGSIAYQIFDAKLRPMLRTEEYDMPGVSVVVADTIGDLAVRIGVDPTRLTATVDDFNRSIDRSVPLDPTVKDGRAAHVVPPKSNWAAPLETGPFYAFPVTCGITFTFGGLRADTDGRVLRKDGSAIPGLYVAGEMLGGLFSGN